MLERTRIKKTRFFLIGQSCRVNQLKNFLVLTDLLKYIISTDVALQHRSRSKQDSIFEESLTEDCNETRTKINFHITRYKYRRFKDTCKEQDISMSVFLKSMIKKANMTAEVDLI